MKSDSSSFATPQKLRAERSLNSTLEREVRRKCS
jgi:hypothetical protein